MHPLSSCKTVFLPSLPGFNLARLTPEQQRTFFGNQLLPLVEKLEPRFAPKITGMLLELDQDKIIHLLESPEALKEMVKEAIKVLENWIPEQLELLKQEIYKFQASILPAKL